MTAVIVAIIAGWFIAGYGGYKLSVAGWLKGFPLTVADQRFFRWFIPLGVSNLLAGAWFLFVHRNDTPSTYHNGPVVKWPKGLEGK